MIELPRAIYDELVYRAYDGEGNEVCGILGGQYGPDRTIVDAVHPAENVADTPQIRYRIDPEEQLRLTEEIEENGRDVAGFYHSHPAGPAQPSATDAARATWPDLSYVIVSLDGYPYVGSWRWRADGERFEQERVVIADADERSRD